MSEFQKFLRFAGCVLWVSGVGLYIGCLVAGWRHMRDNPVELMEPLERWRHTGVLDEVTTGVATLPPTKWDDWGRAVWDDERGDD